MIFSFWLLLVYSFFIYYLDFALHNIYQSILTYGILLQKKQCVCRGVKMIIHNQNMLPYYFLIPNKINKYCFV